MIHSETAHGNLVFSLSHLRKGLIVTIWNKDAIPLKCSVTARLGCDYACNFTLKMMDLATIAISNPCYCSQCAMIFATKQFAEAICIECVPKGLRQAARKAIERIQIKARLLDEEPVPNLIESTQNFVSDDYLYITCLKLVDRDCDWDDFNA